MSFEVKRPVFAHDFVNPPAEDRSCDIDIKLINPTGAINLTKDSRSTYTAIDHITVITSKIDCFLSRGCTDGGNNGGFAADVGVNFGFEEAVNEFLTIPVPPHEFVED